MVSEQILNCESDFKEEKALVGAFSGHCEISQRLGDSSTTLFGPEQQVVKL